MQQITTNTDVQIVPFHWTHPFAMDMREFERGYFEDIPNYTEWLKIYQKAGHCHTALHRGRIACCFGVNVFWPGAAEAWLLTSDLCARYPISLTRGAMRYFNQIAIDLRLHRLQLVVDDRNVLALRWAKALKFEYEGVLRKYGPSGADNVMFSRIF